MALSPFTKLFLLLMAITLLSLPGMAQEGWELVKYNSTVTVYTKQLPGARYKSFKAVGVVQSTPERVLRLLDDVNNYHQWFAYLNYAQVLKREGNEKTVHMETSFPWPFSNEDMIYNLSVDKSGHGEIKLILAGRPGFIPALDGIKRMRNAKGYILLQPEKGHTIVTYVMHTELSGDIPPWVANKYIHLMPFETLNNLIGIAEI